MTPLERQSVHLGNQRRKETEPHQSHDPRKKQGTAKRLELLDQEIHLQAFPMPMTVLQVSVTKGGLRA
jgi:hypothetical protein